jgi:hypothetical protein
MSWTTFDTTQINSKHLKTDKLGGGKPQERSVHSNHFKYEIDHVFTLVLYLATGFIGNQSRGQKLFPGSASNQSSCD